VTCLVTFLWLLRKIPGKNRRACVFLFRWRGARAEKEDASPASTEGVVFIRGLET
jgi:hypothetical protein